MIKDAYRDETKIASAIAQERTYIGNFIYKLMKDRNIRDFLGSLAQKAYNVENLERMERYDFNKNLEEVASILLHFERMLTHSKTFQDRDSEYIETPCRILPDSGGRNALYLLGHLPIILASDSLRRANEFFKREITDPKQLKECNEFQEDILFRDGFIARMYPKDKQLVNQEILNKKIAHEKERFSEKRENYLNSIKSIYEVGEKSDFSFEFYVRCGMTYWSSLQDKSKNSEFTSALTSLIDSINKKSEERKVLLSEILTAHVKSKSDTSSDLVLTMTEDSDDKDNLTGFEVTTSTDLSSYISDIEEIIIVKEGIEAYSIRHASTVSIGNDTGVMTYSFNAIISV